MPTDHEIVRLMKVPVEDHDLDWLKRSLQAAARLEFATIPPYLCAYWSVKSSREAVAQSIYNIVLEEMLHLGIICNLFVAIEDKDSPDLLSVPTYPSPLPGGVHPGLEVSLQGLSKEAAQLFMDIEYPEDGPIGLDEEYSTIGAFYTAIQKAFESIDPRLSETRQLEELSVELMKLRTKQDVLDSIERIKRQGEGSKASPEDTGPDDLAHYYRFGEIYNEKKFKKDPNTGKWGYSENDPLPMPECWPMGTVPLGGYNEDDVKPEVWDLLAKSDAKFTSMVHYLQEAWQKGDQESLNKAVSEMYGLKKPAVSLMQIPIPSKTVTYGPCFRLVTEAEMLLARRKTIVARFVEVLERVFGR